MPTAYRAFRFFGHLSQFKWNSGPSTNKHGFGLATPIPANVVEIFFAEPTPAHGHLHSFARFSHWKGDTMPSLPIGLPPSEDNVFDPSRLVYLMERLEKADKEGMVGEVKDVSFWISDHFRTGQRLVIHGLRALDQFAYPEAKLPTERFPLVEKYEDGNRSVGSILTFGSGGSDSTRVEVALPLASHKDKENSLAAVGGTIPARRDDPKSAFGENGLTGFSVVLVGAPGNTKESDIPSRRLGKFGIKRTGVMDDFAIAPVAYPFWPDHRSIFKETVAGDIGKLVPALRSAEMVSAPVDPSADDPVYRYTGRYQDEFKDLPGKGLHFFGAEKPVFPMRRVEARTLVSCLLNTDSLKAILGLNPDEIFLQTQASLHWKDLVKPDAGAIPSQPTGNLTAFEAGGLVEAARMMEATRTGLLATDRQPQSALPRFAFTENRVTLPLVARLGSHDISGTRNPAGLFRISVGGKDNTDAKNPRFAITLDTAEKGPANDWVDVDSPLTPNSITWKIPAKNPPIAALMALPTFHDPYAELSENEIEKGKNGHWTVELAYDPSVVAEGYDEPKVVITVRKPNFEEYNKKKKEIIHPRLSARLGAIAFWGTAQNGANPTDPTLSGTLTLKPADRRVPDPRRLGHRTPSLHLDWTLDIGLAEALPVTTDIPHGDRTERPSDLLIRDASDGTVPPPDGSAPLLLSLRETLTDSQDRHLTADLKDTSGIDSASRSVTVLTEMPFSAYRFSEVPFESVGGDDTTVVAEYDSDRREWSYRRRSETYLMMRPAGAVGEAADKPGHLELHDPTDRKVNSPPTPVPQIEGGVTALHSVDQRYSPATALWVHPTDLDRASVLPPYASRELFRRRGDFGAGVSLAALRTEALYGLALGLLVPSPSNTGQFPRVAEIETLTGIMADEDTAKSHPTTDARWKRLRKSFAKRPERLEVWTLDPSQSNPFRPARFEDELTFSLRHKAVLARPVDDERVMPADDPASLLKPPRFRSHGLRGGALWPIESANVARVVAEAVVGSRGALENVALSPYGISADQTVEFIGGFVKIISDTRDGMLLRQRVEVLGRIAALWHRAKHVVVYERTTAPSDQFQPEMNQATRTARAALRKVSEYVEILEPVRKYPDTHDAPERARGFLEEVRFNSRIINVDGRWGRDIKKWGWEVPLWNRGASERRPQVYPHPDIAFVTRAEGRESDACVAQDCLDPALLYFVTDAETAVAQKDFVQTDLWPARRGIDATLLSDASFKVLSIDQAPDRVSGEGQRRPAGSRIASGLRRFTWRLSRAAQRSQINAGRSKKPIFAGLESVSFSRSVEVSQAEEDVKDREEKRNSLEKALKGTKPGQTHIAPVPENIGFPKAAQGAGSYGNIVEKLNVLSETAHDDGAVAQIITELEDGIDKLVPDKLHEVGGASEIATLFGKTNWNNLATHPALQVPVGALTDPDAKKIADQLWNADDADCRKLAARAAGGLRRRKLLVVARVQEAQNEAIAYVDNLALIKKDEVRQELVRLIREEVDDLTKDTGEVIGGVVDGIAQARAIAADWAHDARAAIARSRQRLDETVAKFDDTKPWSNNRVEQALAQIDDAVAGAEQDALAALQEARQRMATEISTNGRAAGAHVTTAIGQVLKTSTEVDHSLSKISHSVTGQQKRLVQYLDKIPSNSELGKVLTDLDKRIGKIKNAEVKAKAEAITAKIRAAVSAVNVDDKTAKASDLVNKYGAKAEATLSDIKKAAKAAGDAATTELETLKTELARAQTLLAQENDAVLDELAGMVEGAAEKMTEAVDGLVRNLKVLQDLSAAENAALGFLRATAAQAHAYFDARVVLVDKALATGAATVDAWAAEAQTLIGDVAEQLPDAISNAFITKVLDPALETAFNRIIWPAATDLQAGKAVAREAIRDVAGEVEARLDEFEAVGGEAIGKAEEICKSLVGARQDLMASGKAFLDNLAADLVNERKAFQEAIEAVKNATGDAEEFLKEVAEARKAGQAFLNHVDAATRDIASAGDHARAYLDGGAERLDELFKAKAAELPGRALELASFLATSPDIANFKAAADSLRMNAEAASDILKTPEVRALLDPLGDALKAVGLSFDFREIAETFRIDKELLDGKRFSDLFPSFGGINLSDMLPSTNLPGGIAEAINLTHDLDVKAGRAWVQLDVDTQLSGRERLFSIGPFTLFLTKSFLKAMLRAEASKDTPEVVIKDKAELRTDLEAIVGGQVMVTLQDVLITYSRETDLDFKLDPSKIRINKSMKFIQDTLGALTGESDGPLKYIKESGIIVGVEHNFVLPPIDLMFGTSGVQHLQIANRFSLRAYPDFVIANRFNLSRRELPFIFSFFIIGGTGYVQVDADYRPFDKSLLVVVEAGAGGSASLGFAFGPVTGGVFISIMVTLRYAKRLGGPAQPDDGLTVSLVLVIAGNVSLWGMVTIYLGLMLTISYHESGRVDGLGSLSVELRISRWFKLKFSTQVTYKLRDGKSTTTRTSKTEMSGKAADAYDKLKKLEKARQAL